MSVGIVNLFALHRDLTDLLALDKKWMWACKAAFFLFSSSVHYASRAFSPRFSKMLTSELDTVGEQQSVLLKVFALVDV